MTTETVETAKRWFEEVWNQRRMETVDELLKGDSVCHGEGEDIVGKEGFLSQMYEPFVTAFPDFRITIEDMLAENGQVVVRWSATGTHTGDGLGIDPTGRAVEFHGMTWIKVVNGKMVEGWQSSNISETIRCLAE